MGHLPTAVAGLVDKFREHADHYLSPTYNETLCRIDFINPLFEALGWDMHNRAAYADAYRDVIHEDAIKIGSATKAPDYCFRIGGVRKFFLEAKKPSVDLTGQPGPAYQLRRYAWSAKLPLSILTDFDEFAVYDCRVRPSESDKSSTARIFYCRSEDYAKHWEFIQGTFSREAILKGSFDKYAATNRAKRGTAEVDDAFLAEIETWRDALARNIALRNPSLTQRQLNFAVQVTIDRIIFLRICEDRGIERYGQLLALTNTAGGGTAYRRLLEVFRLADQKYNSGLFHFENERGREPADTLTPSLEIDDKLLKEIIGSLYYPQSPYEFSVLSAEILGHVYEQFLGKVITLTAGHRAKVEEKPEVRKAGGVYYTPTYIVDYIVANTVGKLLGVEPSSGMSVPPMSPRSGALPPSPDTPGEGRGEGSSRSADTMTPKKAAKLRILDPACGSGSFLLGAYQYLLDWHLKHYLANDPAKHATGKSPAIVETPAGYRLTTAERKRILLNNIYGVDIDPQAVEVTKLSLLLKVLEGESQQSLDNQMRLFRERALPDLANNIKCGNSLIGPDFYEGQTLNLFDEETRYRINVFDWKAEFKEIMKDGGFDAVIGNPPYVRQEGVSDHKTYLSARYRSYHGLADLYVYFIERGLFLTKPGGLLAYIVSSKFVQASYGRPVRELIAQYRIDRLIDYGDVQVFAGATTYPVVMVIQHADSNPDDAFWYAKAKPKSTLLPDAISAGGCSVSHRLLHKHPWTLIPVAAETILAKVADNAVPLNRVAGPAQLGIKTSLNEAFVVSSDVARQLIDEDAAAAEILKPYLRGRDLDRWRASGNGSFLVCARECIDIERYPSVFRHLKQYERALRDRYEVRRGDYEWWVVRQVADVSIFDNPKIVYPDLCSHPQFALNTDGAYPNNTVFCLRSNSLGLLGYLNSRIGWYWITRHCPANRGGAFRLFNHYINEIPVRADLLSSDWLASLVDQMLSLQKQLAGVTAQDQAMIQRQIDATDAQIDRLVYELYGLTDEEIRIVESSLAPAESVAADEADEE